MRTSESKGHWQVYAPSALFEPEVRKSNWQHGCPNFGFRALEQPIRTTNPNDQTDWWLRRSAKSALRTLEKQEFHPAFLGCLLIAALNAPIAWSRKAWNGPRPIGQSHPY